MRYWEIRYKEKILIYVRTTWKVQTDRIQNSLKKNIYEWLDFIDFIIQFN